MVSRTAVFHRRINISGLIPDAASEQALESGYSHKCTQLPRSFCFLRPAKEIQRGIVGSGLEGLNDSDGKFPSLLHLRQQCIGHALFTQGLCQDVCGGDRVLDRKIDADTTSR